MTAFTLAAVIFVILIILASLVVGSVSAATIKPIRMTGPAVKKFGGYVLLTVGVWFAVLAFLPSPVLGF